jgi:hypothetical protein
MVGRKLSPIVRMGLAAFVLGIGLRFWTHGNSLNFAAGFFLGLSIALMLAGLSGRPRRTL